VYWEDYKEDAAVLSGDRTTCASYLVDLLAENEMFERKKFQHVSNLNFCVLIALVCEE